MGNTRGGGLDAWRGEKVISAEYFIRPLASSLSSSFGSSGSSTSGLQHHGVVVHTDKGNSFLIHQPGLNSITTVTPASNMSHKWTKLRDIPVKGNKTVQEAFNGAGGRTTNPIINYATTKTCIGAAKGAEQTLKKCSLTPIIFGNFSIARTTNIMQ